MSALTRFEIVRHRLGSFTGFTFGSRFTSKLSKATDLDDQAIQQLFHQLARKHEALRCRLIVETETRSMKLSPLTDAEINAAMNEIIQVQIVDKASQITELETEAHRLHMQRFFDLSEPSPLWKVRVLKCRDNQNVTLSFIFMFHHVIADGRSALALSRDLFRLLQGQSLTGSFGLAPPIETLVDTRITWQILLFQLLPIILFPLFVREWLFGKEMYWTGDCRTILPRKDTYIRGGQKPSPTILLRVQWPNVDKLNQNCRREKTTVHAALTYCFTRSLQDLTQQHIKCLHPVSLRSHAGTSEDCMALHFAVVYTHHKKLEPPNWSNIRQLQHEINNEKDGGIRVLGLMKFLGRDEDAWCQSLTRMHANKPNGRTGSIAFSNLGAVSCDASGPWEWINASFGNDSSLISETLSTTVVTCRGTLDIIVSATKDTVKEEFIAQFLEKSRRYFDQLVDKVDHDST